MRPRIHKKGFILPLVIVVACLFLALCGCGGGSSAPNPATQGPQSQSSQAATEHWPAYTPDPAWQPAIADAVTFYTVNGYTYKSNIADYFTWGDYLNFSSTDDFRNIPDFEQLDANGVPMINYNGTFFYNPSLVAEYANAKYGRWLKGFDPNLNKFWAGINKLMQLQSADGSFRYVFDFPYYLNDNFFRPNWTSGLAQGMALSALARAYLLTGDQKYLVAGDKAFTFLRTSVANGGDTQDLHFLDPSLSNVLFADEYPATPSAYTLNGFMHAMIGVYDWAWIEDGQTSSAAAVYFQQLVRTLDNILPYFDVGGFSAYDLGHVIYKHQPKLEPSYHEVHIYLLHALHFVTGDPTLAKYEAKWAADVPK